MLVDYNKRGTIILSSYRSGGTLLKAVIREYLGYKRHKCKDLGELHVELDSIFSTEVVNGIIETLYCDEAYSVCLLNNPLTVIALSKSSYFPNLVENFNIIYLERKDKEKSILSLSLWEEFIETGLYSTRDNWTPEAMLEFHNKLIANPIPYNSIGLGIPYGFSTGKADQFLNSLLSVYCNNIYLLRSLAKSFNLHCLDYETYENNAGILKHLYFKEESNKLKSIFNDLQKDRIPYVSENYLDYYDDTTRRIFKNWNINSI